ncbi:hypothetical protein YC2023_052413 [Brassica napus]
MWRKHAWTKHARYAEINKKTQKGEARQVDKAGRCVHVSCLQNPSQSSNWCSIWSIKKKIVDGSNMWRKHVWTKHARYAEIRKKTQRVRQDKWTSQGDVFMSPVFKIPPNLPEISSPDSSLHDQLQIINIDEIGNLEEWKVSSRLSLSLHAAAAAFLSRVWTVSLSRVWAGYGLDRLWTSTN